jgi:hypothetical protein
LNLSENLGSSFEYAKKMFSDIGRLIILIVLDVIPLANWIVIGYAARVLRESPRSDSPPPLEKYGELFVDGAKIFFASIIWMIIPIAFIGAGAASFSIASISEGGFFRPESMMFSGTGIVLIVVGAILAFVLLLVLSIGLAHMIRTGRFGKAFAFGEIFRIIGHIGWVKFIGWAVIVAVIAFVVGGIAGAIPYLGWLISVIVSPVLTVFLFRSLGLLYNEGAPPELRAQAVSTTATGMACISCGTPMPPQQKFCAKCGAAAPFPTATMASEEKFCPSCGAKMPAGATFCGNCGAKQN